MRALFSAKADLLNKSTAAGLEGGVEDPRTGEEEGERSLTAELESEGEKMDLRVFFRLNFALELGEDLSGVDASKRPPSDQSSTE